MNINYLSAPEISGADNIGFCINTVCNYSNATANRRLYAVLYSITWHVPLRAWPNRSPSLIFNRRCRCRTLSCNPLSRQIGFCSTRSVSLLPQQFAFGTSQSDPRQFALCTVFSAPGFLQFALLTLCANPLLRLSRRARAARIRCPRAGAGRDPLRGGRSRSRPRVLCPPE